LFIIAVSKQFKKQKRMAKFKYNDGGKSLAGYKSDSGDCVCRAIAIVTNVAYKDVYNTINKIASSERKNRGRSSARNGVKKATTRKVMQHFGLTWTPTMQIGSGCTTHLRADELPKGRIIASVSKHVVAVIDGVIHDTHDCSREGTRCVYGYYTLNS